MLLDTAFTHALRGRTGTLAVLCKIDHPDGEVRLWSGIGQLRWGSRTTQPASLLGTNEGVEIDAATNTARVRKNGVLQSGPILQFFDFSRGSSATVEDASGGLTYVPANTLRVLPRERGVRIEGASTNRCLQSNDLTVSPWGVVSTTGRTAGPLAPDRETRWTRIVETQASSGAQVSRIQQNLSLTANTPCWSGGYLRRGTRKRVLLQHFNFANWTVRSWAVFDLETGTIVNAGGTGSPTRRAWIEPGPHGSWRCSIYGEYGPSGTPTLGIGPRLDDATTDASYVGDGSSYIEAWGFQVEETARGLSSLIPTTSDAATRQGDQLELKPEFMPVLGAAGATLVTEADLGIPAVGAVTAEMYRYLASLDSGALGGQIFLQRYQGPNAFIGLTGNSGTFDGTVNLGGAQDNTFTRVATALNPAGAGRLTGSRDGDEVVADSAVTAPDLTLMANYRIGSQPDNTRHLFGDVRRAALISRALPDDDLQRVSSRGFLYPAREETDVWTGAGVLGSITTAARTTELRIDEVRLSLSGVDPHDLAEVSVEIRNRPAWTWLAIIGPDRKVIGEPLLLDEILLDYAIEGLADNGTSVITLIGQAGFWTLERATESAWSREEAVLKWGTDSAGNPVETGYDYITSLKIKDTSWKLPGS